MKLKVLYCTVAAAAPVAAVMSYCIPVDIGESILYSLGDVSAILFGVFGIWLGFCYKPGLAKEMYGKKDEELMSVARSVKRNHDIFMVVFKGVSISSFILVLSMFSRTLVPMLKKMEFLLGTPYCYWCKFLFFTVIVACLIMQAFSVFMSIVPMADAKKEITRACDEAERVLSV